MIDVCLLNPKTSYNDKEEEKKRKKSAVYKDNFLKHLDSNIREPPSGIMILANIIEQNGFSVDIVDCEILKTPFNYIRENSKKYRLLGVTSLTNTFKYAVQLCKTAKRYNPNLFIIMGGPHVSFRYKDVLRENLFVDVVCVGESEVSFRWLVEKLLVIPSIDLIHEEKSNQYKKYINRPGKIQKILSSVKKMQKGIAYLSHSLIDPFIKELKEYEPIKKRKNVINKNLIPKIKYSGFPDSIDLSNIPLPARHQISMNYTVADVIINRGCPNQCSFCSRTRLFPELRIRPLKHILEEIDQILSYSNYKFVNFYDNINIDKRFFNEFLKALIKRKFPLPWGAELRTDTVSKEEAELMKNANCRIVATGVESADETVLKTNFKFQNPEKVAKGIKLLKQVGIAVQAYFIIGLPGETEESFKKTLEYIKELPLEKGIDRIEFFTATPYPGSDLDFKKKDFRIKIINHNYNLYNCREPIMETSSLNYSQLSKMISTAKEIKDQF